MFALLCLFDNERDGSAPVRPASMYVTLSSATSCTTTDNILPSALASEFSTHFSSATNNIPYSSHICSANTSAEATTSSSAIGFSSSPSSPPYVPTNSDESEQPMACGETYPHSRTRGCVALPETEETLAVAEALTPTQSQQTIIGSADNFYDSSFITSQVGQQSQRFINHRHQHRHPPNHRNHHHAVDHNNCDRRQCYESVKTIYRRSSRVREKLSCRRTITKTTNEQMIYSVSIRGAQAAHGRYFYI